MSDNNSPSPPQKETNRGYEIKRSIIFENDRGFALGENPNAVQPFVTWQFTENENGERDYYWGHYTQNGEGATRDYEIRIAEYQKDYGQSERNAYRYYSTQRPPDIGTFPKTEGGPLRIVTFESREQAELGHIEAWGYLIYDKPLTEKQIADYELRAAFDNPDLKKRRMEQAQVLGTWEERRRTPSTLRLTEWNPDINSFIAKDYVTPEQIKQRYDFVIEMQNRPMRKKPIDEQMRAGAEQAAKHNAAQTTPPKKKEQDISG